MHAGLDPLTTGLYDVAVVPVIVALSLMAVGQI